MPSDRSGQSSRSNASRQVRQSAFSIGLAASGMAPEAQDTDVMKVDSPPAIQRVEALHDLGGRADGGARPAGRALGLCHQGLHHPRDARLGVPEWTAAPLGAGAARGLRARFRRRRAASRRAKRSLRAGQDGSGDRPPLAGRACCSRCLDHQHVRFWGSRRVPTIVGCSAGIRSIRQNGAQFPSRYHYD
jgi:hypothetical protein